MLALRLFTAFATAALVGVAGCSDATAPNVPQDATPITPPIPQMMTISGSVHLTGVVFNEVVLTTADGVTIPLAGAATALLARVDNAGVEVRGSWNSEGAFTVADFVVEIVDGAPVLDGVLIALYGTEIYAEDSTVVGYALRLTRGTTIELKDPSADLLAHVGERIWVACPIDGPPTPTAFGIISE